MKKLILLLALSTLAFTSVANAAWLEIEDFDSIPVGHINGQHGWTASSTSVDIESDGVSDHVLSYWNSRPDGSASSHNRCYKSLTIPNNSTATLFFRVNAVGDVLRHYFGMTDKASPSSDNDYALSIRATTWGSAGDGKYTLNVSEDGMFGSSLTADVGVWYNVWLIIRLSANDRFDAYINSGDGYATPTDMQLSNVYMNYSVSGELTKLLGIVTSESPNWQVTNFWINDVFLDTSGANYSNPVVPEPFYLSFIMCYLLFIIRKFNMIKISG